MSSFVKNGLADRMVWATDVQGPYFTEVAINSVQGESYKDSLAVKVLEEVDTTEEEIAKILGGNAAKLFNVQQLG